MLKRKALAAAIGCSLFLSLAAGKAFADTSCTPVYGGGVVCQRTDETLDKVIKNPATGSWVNGLSSSDDVNTRFSPNQLVEFEIRVTNIGDQTVNNVIVADDIPPYTIFSQADNPGVTYDSLSRRVSFTIGSLSSDPKDDKNKFTQAIKLRVVGSNNLPADKTLLCGPEGIKNMVKITIGDRQRSREVPFCITKTGVTPTPGVFVPSALPKAGAEDFILGGVVSLISGGLYLINKTRRIIK